jgi:hypothetical protein
MRISVCGQRKSPLTPLFQRGVDAVRNKRLSDSPFD